ncbi:outer membrane lipoprotein-sorting protein [Cellvibrio mixtus]|uniref:outer membrane lipoprotein-sorting protein n=1 Tax=Cellvibrio mixtus TaxID=39650 RepID=UPI000586F369|nr:outer membrane lipoprotein-sorting protein [Cellvibrio mixtus]
MKFLSIAAAGISLCFMSATQVAAVTADDILSQVRNRPDGVDTFANASLVLIEKNGSKRVRDLLFLQKDYGKDDKLTLSFTTPADVKGVVLQSINYDESVQKEDDQWMYLPAFRQIRRIAATDKRGSFMGSQFSYIDLDKLRVTDYRQTLVREEKINERDCYVIERIPSSLEVVNRTGYHKVNVWVDKDSSVVVKQVYFDAKGIPFKEFFAKKLEQVQNIWTVTHSEMRDLVNGRTSELIFSGVRYDVGLDDSLFQHNIMKTGVKNGNLPQVR